MWLGGVAVLVTLLVRRVVHTTCPYHRALLAHRRAGDRDRRDLGRVQTLRQTEQSRLPVRHHVRTALLTKIGLLVLIVAAASVSRHIVRLWADDS